MPAKPTTGPLIARPARSLRRRAGAARAAARGRGRGRWPPGSHSDLKCSYSSAQVGSACTSVTDSSGGRPARQHARAEGERARPPLAERADVRAALLGEDVAGEVVAPGEQRHLELEPGAPFRADDDDVVGRRFSKQLADDSTRKSSPCSSEPEERGVEQVRAEVRQHAGALVAPRRVADQPRGAVAVEHAAAIDLAEHARADRVAHAHEVRLEAVVVGRVADRALLAGDAFEPRDVLVVARPRAASRPARACRGRAGSSRSSDLRLVGRADERRVVAVERHVSDRPVVAPRA